MSTAEPVTSIESSRGTAVTAAIIAAAVASPVVCRTSHGKATIVMPAAVPERTVAASRTTNGR
jgi:cellobiose-specific phosphotransferase system component IIC